MNRIYLISTLVLSVLLFIQNIKCEESLIENELNDNKTIPELVEQLPESNGTDTERKGKHDDIIDIIGGAIGAAAVGAIDAVSSSVVRGVIGNQLIPTGEYCTSRRSSRYCDGICHDLYRGPMTGWCRNGLCVCECDSIECDRYCDRRYGYDDYDYVRRRRPYARQRDRGYCGSRGCRCD